MPTFVITSAERRKALFIAFFIPGCFAAYPLLTPEETRDFGRVQKEFRVLALRDGKPFATSLATLPKDATYLLPAPVYELTPDVHKVVVLESTAAWQLVQYEFDNTVSTISRYRAFRDRIEPVSHRMTFHPGLPVAFMLLMLPAWLLAFLASLWWNTVSPPPPAPPPALPARRRSSWSAIVAMARGVMRAASWTRSVAQARGSTHVPDDQRRDESPVAPVEPRRSRFWIVLGTAVAVLATAGLVVMSLMPDYADYTKRAKVSEAILALSAARAEINEFYREHGRLPKDMTEGNLASTLRPYSSRVREIRYEQGVVTGVIANIEPYEGKQVILRAHPVGDTLKWTCFVRGIPARDVPSLCRSSE